MALGAGAMGALAFLFNCWLASSFANQFLLVGLPALLGLLAYYLLSRLGGFLRVVQEGWASD
jgi:hypothetical protein